ncbi:MAG: ribosome maturation factor RimM [Burkholderiales bacterium]|nr:ribosome maturation factor RimM [Burkholderiales bacterium]
MPPEHRIVMGRIGAPFGVRGEVKVQCFGDDPARLAAIDLWWLQGVSDVQPVKVERARVQGNAVVASLEGVVDREQAIRLKGREVAVARDALPDAGEGEYYWFDLEGLAVVDRDGIALGRVESVTHNGAHSVLVVHTDTQERLIPFVAAIVDGVDIEAGRITVDWGADW